MKKVAILGGTFNPIHHGHIIILQQLYDTKVFDEIWIMPAGQQPFKQESKETKAARLKMCQLVCDKLPYVHLSTAEITQEGPSYTFDTLSLLTETYKDTLFYWTIGYDNLNSILHWYKSEALLATYPFILVNRGGYLIQEAESIIATIESTYSTQLMKVTIPNIELSSSLLRERVQNKQSLVGFTLESIIDFIEDNGLYQKIEE